MYTQTDLELNRQRLNYYMSLKNKLGTDTAKMGPVDKWIEIYADRVKKLEKQIAKKITH